MISAQYEIDWPFTTANRRREKYNGDAEDRRQQQQQTTKVAAIDVDHVLSNYYGINITNGEKERKKMLNKEQEKKERKNKIKERQPTKMVCGLSGATSV